MIAPAPVLATPAFHPPISASNLPEVDADAFLAYAQLSHDARRYANGGPAVTLLEERLAAFHCSRHCVTVPAASEAWS